MLSAARHLLPLPCSSTARAALACALLAWCALGWPAPAAAQNVQHTSKLADSIKRSNSRVDPTSLALNLEIPLGEFPGRGETDLPVTLHYSSKVWRIAFVQTGDREFQEYDTWAEARYTGGWTISLAPPTVEAPPSEFYDANGLPGPPGCCRVVRRVLAHLPDGSTHELRHDNPIAVWVAGQPAPSFSGTYRAVDGSDLRYDWDSRTLFMPDGSRYVIGQHFPAVPTVFIDRHGNKRTYDPTANRWTDSLGREIPLPFLPGFPPNSPGDQSYALPGVGGVPVNFILRWRSLADVRTDPSQPLHHISDCYGIAPATPPPPPHLFTSDPGQHDMVCNLSGPFNPVVLHEIVLPNNTSYKFTYNVYGEVDKVVHPTGGYERFVHGTQPPADWVTGVYVQGNRGVGEHFISATGAGADEVRWQYGAGGPPYKVVVIAPDNTRTERLIHAATTDQTRWGFGDVRIGRTYDERVFTAAGQMVRRTLTEWAGTTQASQPNALHPRVTRETELLLDTGGNALAATSFHGYDADFNRTSTDEHDFVSVAQTTAQTAAIGVIPAGTLARRDETTYLVNDPAIPLATRDAYRARNLVQLPTSTRVKNPAGSVLAQSRTSYDEAAYPLFDCAPPVGRADPGTNVRGNATSSGSWLDTTGAWIETHARYDQCGNVRYEWDAEDYLTQTEYSADYHQAYPTRTISPTPDPSGQRGSSTPLETATVYDFTTGLVTSTTDANGRVTTRDYSDPLNRLKREVRAAGTPAQSQTTWVYDDAARVVAVTSDLNAFNDNAVKAEAVYDGLGRLAESRAYESAAAYLAARRTYDALGRPHQVSNQFRSPAQPSAWTTTLYDALGRVTTVTTHDNAVVSTAYAGNEVTVTDQAGRRRRRVSDALGRLTRVVEDPLGAAYATDYVYDALGNLRKVNQGGQLRYFMYDSLSRLVRARNPEQVANPALAQADTFKAPEDAVPNSQWCYLYEYDDNGNLKRRVDPRGVTADYVYDPLDRNLSITYAGGGVTTPDVVRAYDLAPGGRGQLWWSVAVNTSATTFDRYDELGRPTERRQNFWTGGDWGDGFVVRRTYDLAGNVRTQTYPSGRAVSYTYDAAGRLSAFTGNLGDGTPRTYADQFLYDEQGGLRQERFGTQTPVFHKRFYNVRRQLTEIRVSTYSVTTPGQESNWNRGALINHYSHQSWAQSGTDNNANLRKQDIYIPNNDAISGWSLNTLFYDYDAFNRLDVTHEVRDGVNVWMQDFDYDRWGNRTINPATYGAPEPQFDVNTSTNRLGVPAGQTGEMSYDNAGNLARDTYTGGGDRAYDAENRMTSAQLAGGQTAAYTYDAEGKRVKRNPGAGGEVWQVYDMDGELAAEYATNAAPASPQKEYGYRAGELLVTAEPASAAPPVNVALAANGATAAASSTLDAGRTALAAINGDRKGVHWGTDPATGSGWHCATQNAFPDWLEVTFNGPKTIQEINVFSVQDNFNAPQEPTEAMTFTQYGLTSFQLEYWTGSAWAQVPGASASGNNQVWRKFTLQTPVTTTKIRVVVNGALGNYSRITEVEAWAAAAASEAKLAPSAVTASSTYGSNAPANAADGNQSTSWLASGFPQQWIQYDLGQARDLTKVRLLVSQDPAGPTTHQVWGGPTPTSLTFLGTLSGATQTGQWLELSAPAAGVRYVRVLTTQSPSWVAWMEVEVYGLAAGGGGGADVRWLVSDQLGTPRMVFDQTGSLSGVRRHDYFPFGEEIPAGVSGRTAAQGYVPLNALRERWATYERDDETGLDFAQARYYSSPQGRFTSPDEFKGGPDELYSFAADASDNPTLYADPAAPQSLNKYQYALNNPLRYIDPDGHCPECPAPGPAVPGVPLAPTIIRKPSIVLDAAQLLLSVVGTVPGAELADVANAGISAARGNYGEAVLDLAGALGPGGSATATGNRARKIANIVGETTEAAGVVKRVHGNSSSARRLQHGYEIVDQAGDVQKVGVSGQKLNRNGSSPRANRQVSKANQTRSGKNKVQAVVKVTKVKSRKQILEWEKRQAAKRKNQGHSMRMHRRP